MTGNRTWDYKSCLRLFAALGGCGFVCWFSFQSIAAPPVSLEGFSVRTTTTAASGAFAGSEGESTDFSFGAGGNGTKTKDGAMSAVTYSGYSVSGNMATFQLTDSGQNGMVTLTFADNDSGAFFLSVGTGNSQSGTFQRLIAPTPPTLISAGLQDGVVTLVFSEPMDTGFRSLSWISPAAPGAGAFSNFRWSADQRTLTFNAALSEGTRITFVLNPPGGGSEFRDLDGVLLTANTQTAELTANNSPVFNGASFTGGVVSFTFNEPMDTAFSAHDWTADPPVEATAFSNPRWNPAGTVFSFDAALPGNQSVTFTLSPAGNSNGFRDLAGTSLTGNRTATVTAPGPAANRVLSLDGTGDHVTIPSSAAIQPATELTIEAWLKPTHNPARNNARFINKGDGASANSSRTYELVYTLQNELIFTLFFETGPRAVVQTIIPPRPWFHFAATFESVSGALNLYTNGVLADVTRRGRDNESLVGLSLRQTTLPLILGYTPTFSSTFATGEMDEIRIWSRVRSVAEIANAMRNPPLGTEANLEGYWTFDDGNISDTSGNSPSGQLVGDAMIVTRGGSDDPRSARIFGAFNGPRFDLRINSETNRVFRLEHSTDLSAWSLLRHFVSANATTDLSDTNAATKHRFYRVRTP